MSAIAERWYRNVERGLAGIGVQQWGTGGVGGGNLFVFKLCICFSILHYTLYFFLLYSKLWRAAHLCGQLPTIHVHIDV